MKNLNKSIIATLLLSSFSPLAFATITDSAGQLTGTVPVLKGTGSGAKDHSISFTNGHESGSTQAMSPKDVITLSYTFVDSEGDTDSSKTTIKWFSTSDGKTGDKQSLNNDGKDTFTLTEAEAGRYIGAEITEQTSTGIPTQGQLITVSDIGANDPSDDIPDGPVVGGYIGKMIVDSEAPDINLIGKTDSKLLVGHKYQFKVWYDVNNNNIWDVGEVDASKNYSYEWFFDGTSATTATAGGYALASTNNKDLTIPAKNDQATLIFAGAGADGVQGYGLKVDYSPLVSSTHHTLKKPSVKSK